jgi:magnesium-transporting ATPase (P-type)
VKLTDLVVGDIVSVDAGNKVPADCILIEEMNITVDETIYGRGNQESKSLS